MYISDCMYIYIFVTGTVVSLRIHTGLSHAHVQLTLDKNVRNKANEKFPCKNIHECRDGAASR